MLPGIEVGLGPGDFMFDGDPAPPEKNGTTSIQFLAHVYCGHGRPFPLLLSSCYEILGSGRDGDKEENRIRF